jgi:hypothetical protein
MEVRPMCMRASTPKTNMIGSRERWKLAAMAMRTTRLARGTPANAFAGEHESREHDELGLPGEMDSSGLGDED